MAVGVHRHIDLGVAQHLHDHRGSTRRDADKIETLPQAGEYKAQRTTSLASLRADAGRRLATIAVDRALRLHLTAASEDRDAGSAVKHELTVRGRHVRVALQ